MKISEKLFTGVPGLQKKRLYMVVDYLQMLSEVDKLKATNYHFFEGETFYSIGDYDQAMKTYYKALKLGLEQKKTIDAYQTAKKKDPKAKKATATRPPC